MTLFTKRAASVIAAVTAPAVALVTAGVLAASSPAAALESGTYRLDPEHASIVWTVQHLGLSNYTARFDSFDIQLTLNFENPAASSVSATIDPTSVNTGYPGDRDFDGQIATDGRFLNAGQFPQITFTSTSVEMTGETTAVITGDLTIVGVTQEITLDAELVGTLESHPLRGAPAVGFVATGVLNRLDFGVSYLSNPLPNIENGPPVVSPEVRFTINAEFIKASE